MTDGFIKVPRVLFTYPELQKHDSFYVLMMLLSLMRFRGAYMDGVDVGVHQLVISKPELAARCGVTESRLKYILSSFERAGGISTVNNRNKSTLITVLDRYLPTGEAAALAAQTPRQGKGYKKAVGQTSLLYAETLTDRAEGTPADESVTAPDTHNASEGDKKKPYGVFGNVYLTDDEYERLRQYTPKSSAWIDRLSSYMRQKNCSYDDHFATIIGWVSDADTKESAEAPEKPKTYTGNFVDNSEFYERLEKKLRNSTPKLIKRR